MEEVDDEPLFCERVAGIDIGKAVIMVTIRVPGDTPGGRRQQETREFRAVRKDLLALCPVTDISARSAPSDLHGPF